MAKLNFDTSMKFTQLFPWAHDCKAEPPGGYDAFTLADVLRSRIRAIRTEDYRPHIVAYYALPAYFTLNLVADIEETLVDRYVGDLDWEGARKLLR